MNPSASKRWRFHKLPKRELQLKLTLTFVGLSALAMLLQAILFTAVLLGAAMELPSDGSLLLESTNALVLKVAAVSFLVFLPLTFFVGILSTFRIAGPIYRFEQFLKSVARGEQRNPCKIRKGDELQELCEIINEATESLRRSPPAKAMESHPAKPAETLPAKPAESHSATPAESLPAKPTDSPSPSATESPKPIETPAPVVAAAAPEPAAPMPASTERDPAPTCR